jgi:hypothetical protein
MSTRYPFVPLLSTFRTFPYYSLNTRFFSSCFSALFIFPNYSVSTLFLPYFFSFSFITNGVKSMNISTSFIILLQPVNRVLYSFVIISKFYLCRWLRMSSLYLITSPENHGQNLRRKWNWNSPTWEHPLEVNRKEFKRIFAVARRERRNNSLFRLARIQLAVELFPWKSNLHRFIIISVNLVRAYFVNDVVATAFQDYLWTLPFRSRNSWVDDVCNLFRIFHYWSILPHKSMSSYHEYVYNSLDRQVKAASI